VASFAHSRQNFSSSAPRALSRRFLMAMEWAVVVGHSGSPAQDSRSTPAIQGCRPCAASMPEPEEEPGRWSSYEGREKISKALTKIFRYTHEGQECTSTFLLGELRFDRPRRPTLIEVEWVLRNMRKGRATRYVSSTDQTTGAEYWHMRGR
jgi:hypothetical protein